MANSWTLRLFKSWQARDMSRAWVNNYEIVTTADLTPPDLIPVVNTLAAAEKVLHRSEVQFLQATISTWSPDSRPYNPLVFTTVQLAGAGSVVRAADAEDSNVCLVVAFTCDTGRNGRRFYRGCLSEDDVQIGGDARFTLVAANVYTDTGATMNSFRTALAPLLPGGAGVGKLMLMYAHTGIVSVQRAVTGIHTLGVTINKRNHRYFDRGAPG